MGERHYWIISAYNELQTTISCIYCSIPCNIPYTYYIYEPDTEQCEETSEISGASCEAWHCPAIRHNIELKNEPNIEPNIALSFESDIEPNIKLNIEPNIEPNLETQYWNQYWT